MENAKKFFEEIIKTEEAKTILSSFEKPENEEDALKIYADVAKKLGISLSEDEIKAYLAEKAPSGEVDDEELSQLSGGGKNAECKDTFMNEENCWWEDGCDGIFNRYGTYICKKNYYIEIDGYYVKRCDTLLNTGRP